MRVKDAFKKIQSLKQDKVWYQSVIQNNLYHVDSEPIMNAIKQLNKEIARLEELIYNQELDDSYDQNEG